jgi:uncharacterized protein
MKSIDVRELLEAPGTARREPIDEVCEDLRLELEQVDGPVRGNLLLEGVSEGVYATGTLEWKATMSCARCLEEFSDDFEAKASGMFALHPDEDSYPIAEQGDLDPEPLVRDTVLLAMPFAPLCREDCRGLCMRCGSNLNEGACGCAEPAIDPRWTGLEAFVEPENSNN